MIRRLTIAAALAGCLSAMGAATVNASPLESTTSRAACVAVHAVDLGYCVSNPLPGLPRP